MADKNKSIARITAFRKPIVSAELKTKENTMTSFADLVRMLAEGIADAQRSLDQSSAEILSDLAETNVNIVRSITETVDKDGNITYQHGESQSISLLELGVLPTFYQFSEATIEVNMDIVIEEDVDETSTTKGRKVLFANTRDVRMERKLGRDITMSSKLTTTLKPVPMPLHLEPSRNTEVE